MTAAARGRGPEGPAYKAVKDVEKDERNRNEIEEEPRDETTAVIYGYDYPATKPIGRCCFCGGEVWPIEDACWDGAKTHFITFAYECYGCGHFDVSPYFAEEK